MNEEDLIKFEADIASLFNNGQIKAPIHLHSGNERQLIDIFKDIKPDDWVFSTHRSHYHALLKGIPPELVKSEILKGNSICLRFPEYRFYTSGIVGGVIPIALGVAMAGERAWCFIGDMAGYTGIFNECYRYATNHDLPIKYIIEDNHYSVDSPTDKVWGYKYERTWPHSGTGKWITTW